MNRHWPFRTLRSRKHSLTNVRKFLTQALGSIFLISLIASCAESGVHHPRYSAQGKSQNVEPEESPSSDENVTEAPTPTPPDTEAPTPTPPVSEAPTPAPPATEATTPPETKPPAPTPPVTKAPTPTPTVPKAPAPTNPTIASEAMKQFGLGFNLGNTFDYSKFPATAADAKGIIDLYYNAGYRHMRLPVTWMDGFNGDHLADSNGNIRTNHLRFVQLVAVIDYAISKGMYVIINTHHEHWLKNNYDASDVYEKPFVNLWTQIANYFRDYSYRLVFEVLNEPEGAFGDFSRGANPRDARSLSYTRRINQIGYDAIRATGGANLKRIVLIMPNAQGNQSLAKLVYPNINSLPMKGADPYLAMTVHTYDPWLFCGQGGSNLNRPETASIVAGIDATAAHARLLKIPIHWGEFGVGRITNQAERDTDIVRSYYRSLWKAVLKNGMSAAVWDDRGMFGIVTKDNASGNYQFLHNIAPSMIAP